MNTAITCTRLVLGLLAGLVLNHPLAWSAEHRVAGLSQPAISQQTGQPLRFNALKAQLSRKQGNERACILGLGIPYNTAFNTALVPVPPVDQIASFAAYGLNLGLKYCPPELTAPDAMILEPPPGECDVTLRQSVLSEERGNILGVPLSYNRNWGQFGTPETFHWNTDVLVSAGLPVESNTPGGTSYTLPVGRHEVNWQGDTLASIFDSIPFYFPGLPKGIEKKVGKNTGRILEFMANVLFEAGLITADQLLNQGIFTSVPTGVSTVRTQQIDVLDDIRPVISANQTAFTFEALDLGGATLSTFAESGRTAGELLRDSLTVTDNCSPVTTLNPVPTFWPVNEVTEQVWIARDQGINRQGQRNESIFVHRIFVQDTLAPILSAPMSQVVESADLQTPVALGQPRVFDFGDPSPQISHDALQQPGVMADSAGRPTFPAGLTTVTWTATDQSGNQDIAIQTINVKLPGTNLPPTADAGISAQALSFEPVSIRLTGSDPDQDALTYRIEDAPENGSFVAPLYPYFIEDYRLSPTAGVDRCTQGRAEDLVVEPQYVVVSDEGVSYVLNAGLNPEDDCNPEDPFFFLEEYRISMFDEDGQFIRGRDLPQSQDLFGLSIDLEQGEITYLIFDFSVLAPKILILDASTLETIRTYGFDQPRSGLFKVVIDENNVLYTSTGFGLVDAFDLNQATTSNGIDFILPYEPVKRMRTYIDPADPENLFAGSPALDLVLDSQGQLTVSSFKHLYRFEPSRRMTDGNVEVGEQIGWMGACLSGEGCDPANGATRGFSCTNQSCLYDFSAGRNNPGQFFQMGGIAIDPNDNLYVSDNFNDRIQRFTPDGIFAGQAQSVCPSDQRCFVLGDFGRPRAVSVNSEHFYVVDQQFDILHSFETSVIDPQDDGSAMVTYRSANGFTGTDSFAFLTTDGLDESPSATVNVAVSRNFRPPEVLVDAVISGQEDQSLPVRLFASDPDGALDTLSYRVLQAPEVGTLTGNGADRLYLPPADFFGDVTLRYDAFDGLERSGEGQLILRVRNVNDAPVVTANFDSIAGAGYPFTLSAAFGDVDRELDLHTVTIDWGDGQQSSEVQADSDGMLNGPVLFENDLGEGDIVAMHAYAPAGGSGQFSPEICVTDQVVVVEGRKLPTETSLISCLSPGPISVSPMADLYSRTGVPETAQPGLEFEYLVEFGNRDNEFDLGIAANDILLSHQLDGPISLTGIAPNDGVSCDLQAQGFTCQRSSLNPDTVTFVRVFARVSDMAQPGSVIDLETDVIADSPADPYPENAERIQLTVLNRADLVVNSLADLPSRSGTVQRCESDTGTLDQVCTLRAAVQIANAAGQDEPLRIAIGPGDYQLGQTGRFDTGFVGGQLVVTSSIHLIGLGADLSRLIGNGSDRLFHVLDGGQLTLEQLTLSEGISEEGGGILIDDATVHLASVTLSDHQATGPGGAIRMRSNDSRLHIEDSSILDNRAERGAGIEARGQLALLNTTVAGNQAQLASGGGLASTSATVLLRHVSMSGNRADTGAGANLWLEGGSLTLSNSILDGDTVTHVDCISNPSVTSLGGNLMDAQGCSRLNPGALDRVDGDARFTSLRSEAGGSSVLAIAADSDAIDLGVDAHCLANDQRGRPRLQDGNLDGQVACDSGSYEAQVGPDLTAALSGAYFDSARNGEGSFIEMLPGNRQALVATFTYSADGLTPAWFLGVGEVTGNSIRVPEMVTTEGGVFGPALNPDLIQRPVVGISEFVFPDCQAGSLPGAYRFTQTHDSDFSDLHTRASRLSRVVDCNQSASSRSGRSGAFFDDARDGEGIFVQWLPDGRVILIWYTYDSQGNQFWTIGTESVVNGREVEIDMVYPAQTTAYGENFDPDQIELQRWGTVTLNYLDCDQLRFEFESELDEFGAGAYDYRRLTRLSGTSCDL